MYYDLVRVATPRMGPYLQRAAEADHQRALCGGKGLLSHIHCRHSVEPCQVASQDGVCTVDVDVGFVQMPDVAMSRGMWLATLPINNAVLDVQVATAIAC